MFPLHPARARDGALRTAVASLAIESTAVASGVPGPGLFLLLRMAADLRSLQAEPGGCHKGVQAEED